MDVTPQLKAPITQEYVPVMIFGSRIKDVNLGILETFSDIGQTVADLLGCEKLKNGKSFKELVIKA